MTASAAAAAAISTTNTTHTPVAGPDTALPLPSTVSALLGELTVASPAQLGLLILQQPHLPRLLSCFLQKLAIARLAHDLDLFNGSNDFANILLLLEHASSSQDPSLVRRLLPARETVIHLCLLASHGQSHRLRDFLPSLVDEETSEELLIAAVEACRAAPSRLPTQLSRAVRIAFALLRHLPSASKPQAQGRAAKLTSDRSANHAKADDLASVLAAKYSQIGSSQSIQALSSKIHILDATHAQLQRHLDSGQIERLASSVALLSSYTSTPSASTSSTSSQPLLDLPLLADLLIAHPALIDSVRMSLSSTGSSGMEYEIRRRALEAVAWAEIVAHDVLLRANHVAHNPDLHSIGGGWQLLIEELQASRQREEEADLPARQAYINKGKAKASSHQKQAVNVSSSLMSMVEAILPQLAADNAKLERILGMQKYAGKGEEEVIQMLLDEDLEASHEVRSTAEDLDGLSLHDRASSVPPTRTTSPSTGISSKTRRRANIFNDRPLDATRLRWAGEEASVGPTVVVQPVSSSLKSQILARVSAQTAEEEAALRGEEWNPFSAPFVNEVGFEEELDEAEQEDERLNRRRGISQLGGESGNARDWRCRWEDLSDVDDDYDEGGEGDAGSNDKPRRAGPGGRAGGGEGDGVSTPDGAASERMAERILILAYSQHGPALFSRDSVSRRSVARKDLKRDLGASTGKTWDDSLVESWATMFERNPRKESLLASATNHGIFTGGNPNLLPPAGTTTTVKHSAGSTFGPDRGRGGRLPRRGTGGTGGGGRGGGGGGGDARDGNRNGGGTGDAARGRGAGGHSGNDRGAKNKERRGNSARTRGADRKARMMGGPGAGVGV